MKGQLAIFNKEFKIINMLGLYFNSKKHRLIHIVIKTHDFYWRFFQFKNAISVTENDLAEKAVF